jgi:hypothetical protein
MRDLEPDPTCRSLLFAHREHEQPWQTARKRVFDGNKKTPDFSGVRLLSLEGLDQRVFNGVTSSPGFPQFFDRFNVTTINIRPTRQGDRLARSRSNDLTDKLAHRVLTVGLCSHATVGIGD